MTDINLKSFASEIAAQVRCPVWHYAVPFNHQSISVLLPKDSERHSTHMHAFIMTKRLEKELFTYAQMAGSIIKKSHPLIRYAVAQTDEDEIQNGIGGSLCGISVFGSDELNFMQLHAEPCIVRVTLAVVDGVVHYHSSEAIRVEPLYTDEDLAEIESWLEALKVQNEENQRNADEFIARTQEQRKATPAQIREGESEEEYVERCAQSILSTINKSENHGEGQVLELKVPGAERESDDDDFADAENRRPVEQIEQVDSGSKYVSMYDRHASKHVGLYGSWPRIVMESVNDSIGLSTTAQVISKNMAHVEWKDGTDSRLHIHVNDEMFTQLSLDALDLLRFAGEIGVILHNAQEYPYRSVDFAGVKYVSQTFKYVPGSKAKPQRVYTFSYATKTEVAL